jgi:hypothetical protein
VVDRILADELKRVVGVVCFEDPHCALGEREAESVALGVEKLYLVASFEVGLRVASCVDVDLVVFANLDAIDFWDELNLLLGVIVEGDWLAESIQVIIRKGLLGEGRRGAFSIVFIFIVNH